jgi:choline-sulfatase
MQNIFKTAMAFILTLIGVATYSMPTGKERPNIIFMHVDQMHFDAMSTFGNPNVKTPGMDKLADDGYAFRKAYSSMPQCCPARASWYTGRTSAETGVPANGAKLREDLPDLGQWLRKEGNYHAAYAGKWHIPGREVGESFDLIYGQPSGMGEYIDGSVARACMGFLENYKDDKPFFLNAGFLNPHDCCFTAMANGGQGKFRIAEDIKDQLPPLPENFRFNPKYEKRLKGWDEDAWRYYIYTYYRWVEMVDAEIAALYDALKNSRFADNTILVFTADHGDGLGFHGSVSKGYLEDESWRVATIVIDPKKGIKGKQDNEHLSIGVDMTATICDYAQVPMMPKMTVAKSLRPLVEGKKIEWRDYIVGESFHGSQVAVRDNQYKTIYYCDNKGTKVFDMKADPLEMNNLASSSVGEKVRKKHKKYLAQYIDKIEVFEPQKQNKHHKIYLDYYNNFDKNMKQEALLNTKNLSAPAIAKRKKAELKLVPNIFEENYAIEPITGFLPTFTLGEGKSMNGDFTAHYALVSWSGATDISRNNLSGYLDVTFEDGRCQTTEKRDGSKRPNSNSFVKTTMQLKGKNNTTTQWEIESGVEGVEHVNLIEKGTWDGTNVSYKNKSWARKEITTNPLIHRWALLPVLASGRIKKAPLVFDMLDDCALRKNQTLRYQGKIDVPVKDGNVKMDSYVQTGYGIVPTHYLVDNNKRVQLITMGAVSWALTNK